MGVSIKNTLSTVDELVSGGQHKVAIDLLLEYLRLDSNSSIILSTLGRAYRIDNQPEKAVLYLRRSLDVMRGTELKSDRLVTYQPDNFDDDDMGFIELEANRSLEEEYRFEVDESNLRASNKEKQGSMTYRSLLGFFTAETRVPRSEEDIKRVQLVCRDKREHTLNCNEVLPPKWGDWDGLLEDMLNFISSIACDKTRKIIPENIDNGSIVKQKSRSPLAKDTPCVISIPSNLNLDKEATGQPVIDENQLSGWVDEEKSEVFQNDRISWDKISDDNIDDQDREILDGLTPTSFIILEEELDEQFEGQGWDDFECLEEFDEDAHRGIEEQIQGDGKIGREDRARQVAVEVIEKSDWDLKYLLLLQNIFIENGWSAGKAAIEREIGKGLLPEELFLARKIRIFWAGNERYWMTFHKIKYNAQSQQTDAFYKSMSWPESLRIIRCFPSIPDIEEIYRLIDEVFDHWYNNRKLRRNYPAFFQFLKHRVESMRRPLHGETVFSFLYYETDRIDANTDRLNNSISPESHELLELGFQIN